MLDEPFGKFYESQTHALSRNHLVYAYNTRCSNGCAAKYMTKVNFILGR